MRHEDTKLTKESRRQNLIFLFFVRSSSHRAFVSHLFSATLRIRGESSAAFHRQLDEKSRAFARRRIHFDLPAVIADNAIADAQSQSCPRAGGLGGEERIENPRANRRIDAVA